MVRSREQMAKRRQIILRRANARRAFIMFRSRVASSCFDMRSDAYIHSIEKLGMRPKPAAQTCSSGEVIWGDQPPLPTHSKLQPPSARHPTHHEGEEKRKKINERTASGDKKRVGLQKASFFSSYPRAAAVRIGQAG